MIPGAQGQSREPRRTRAASRPGGGCAGVPAGRRRRRAEPSEVDDRVRPARAAASPNASAAPHRCAEVRVAQRVHEVAGASQPARGVLKVVGSCTSPWMVCWRRCSSRDGVLSLLSRGRSRPGPGTVGWPRSRRRRPRAPSPRPLNISASVTGVAGQQPGPHGARDLRRGAGSCQGERGALGARGELRSEGLEVARQGRGEDDEVRVPRVDRPGQLLDRGAHPEIVDPPPAVQDDAEDQSAPGREAPPGGRPGRRGAGPFPQPRASPASRPRMTLLAKCSWATLAVPRSQRSPSSVR